MRRTLSLLCRDLDTAGFGVIVPDVPGMGEHVEFASETSFAHIHETLDALAATLSARTPALIVAGFRAGCLFDAIPSANGMWRFVPEPGERLVRTLMRTEAPDLSSETHAFVQGQSVSRQLLADLSVAGLPDNPKLRTVRLTSDRAPADLTVEASPLWRHAEPGEDPKLAALLATDIIGWAKSCVAS